MIREKKKKDFVKIVEQISLSEVHGKFCIAV